MSSDELAPLSVRRERERIAQKRIREVMSCLNAMPAIPLILSVYSSSYFPVPVSPLKFNLLSCVGKHFLNDHLLLRHLVEGRRDEATSRSQIAKFLSVSLSDERFSRRGARRHHNPRTSAVPRAHPPYSVIVFSRVAVIARPPTWQKLSALFLL